MKFYSDNHQLIEATNLQQIYALFSSGPKKDRVGRRNPITLEDGTVVTLLIATKGLMEGMVQNSLDAKARSMGYDNALTASLRAGYAGPYQAEGVKFATWMDDTWSAAYAIINAITDPALAPERDAFLASLPVYPA